jgi:hypothetical protein
MATQRMTIEWVRRVKALKQHGFDVSVTVDADGVIINIRKKPSIYPLASHASTT